jgi:hypothetical protein
VAPPTFDDDLGFLQCVEDFAVEQLIAKLRVEALAISILPGTARHDVGGLGSDRLKSGIMRRLLRADAVEKGLAIFGEP